MDSAASQPSARPSAKGRIAQVLAQARATLNEPSRPITPASYEDRMALKTKQDPLDANPLSRISAMARRKVPIATAVSLPNFPSASPYIVLQESTLANSSRTKTSDFDKINMLVRDIKDELNSYGNLGKCMPNDRMKACLESLIGSVESLVRSSKGLYSNKGSSAAVADVKRLDGACCDVSSLLSQVAKEGGFSFDLRLIACRLGLQLNLARFTSAREIEYSTDISQSILQLLQTVYSELAEQDSSSSALITPTASTGCSISFDIGLVDLSIDYLKLVWAKFQTDFNAIVESGNTPVGYTLSGHDYADGVGASSSLCESGHPLDSQLEALRFMGMSDSGTTTTISASGEGGSRVNTHTRGGRSSADLASTNVPKDSKITRVNYFLGYLDAAVYASGILRLLSATVADRKRLLQLTVLDRVNEALVAAGAFAKARVNIARSYEDEEVVGEGQISSITATALSLSQKVMDRLVKALVQLTSTVRNVSLDPAGRAQILRCNILGAICGHVRYFWGCPELILNFARITAKLSLLENFRAQINRHASNVKHLADIVILEAGKCQDVMDGVVMSIDSQGKGKGQGPEASPEEGISSSAGSTSWPSWHTWPLLSRVAFTLGNLTTTNERNREIIGVDCKCLKPLVVLLQACAGALTELCSEEVLSECGAEEEEEDDDEYDNEDNDDGNVPYRRKDYEGINGEEGGERRGLSGRRREVAEADNEDDEGDGEAELWDATIKLLRLLVNLCIEPSLGNALAQKYEALQMLIDLLMCCTTSTAGTSKRHRTRSSLNDAVREELLLNIVAACTNLSFYACQSVSNTSGGFQDYKDATRPSQQQQQQQNMRRNRCLTSLAMHLSQCLFHDNEEIVLETARALGNLTRRPDILHALRETRADEALTLMLAHKNPDILTAVTGTLVNLSASMVSRRTLFFQATTAGSTGSAAGISPTLPLISVLRRASLKDIGLSALVCQVFHNLLLHVADDDEEESQRDQPSHTSSKSILSPDARSALESTLTELLECAQESKDSLLSAVQAEGDDDNDDVEVADVRSVKKNKYSDFIAVGGMVLRLLTTAHEDEKKADGAVSIHN